MIALSSLPCNGERMLSMKRFWAHTRGNVAMIFALSLVLVTAAGGGGVELHNAASARQDMQDAMDAAVLAGVRAYGSSMSTVASATFSHNLASPYSGASQSYSASSASSGSATSLSVTGTASIEVPTKIMGLFGIPTMTMHAKSVAVAEKANAATPCIYVLDPSGSQALLVNSGAQVT